MKLEKKVTIVTGAGKGIGRAIALCFAEEGAKLVVADIEESSAEHVAETIRARGREALAVRADVGKLAEVEGMVEQAAQTFGRIDILVNNSGIRRDVPFYKLTEEEWDSVISAQLKGAFNCARTVQKHMIEQNYGKIINLSSPLPPSVGSEGQTSYATATAGVQGFTVALARELGPYNINVNCIAPDYIDTEMTRNAARREGLYLADFKKLVLPQIPLRRLGRPEDVATVALFLASDDSGFVSGQTIYVKGGP